MAQLVSKLFYPGITPIIKSKVLSLPLPDKVKYVLG